MGINTRFIHIDNSIIEGSGMNNLLAYGDLLELGDTANAGTGATQNISNVSCSNLTLINPLLSYAALHVGSVPSTSGCTGFVQCGANITSTNANYGRGVQAESCTGCYFDISNNTSTDYNLIVGTITSPATNFCGGSDHSTIVYDGHGAETGLSACIDAAAGVSVQTPMRQLLALGSTAGTPPPLCASAASTPSSPLTDIVSPFGANVGTTFKVSPAATYFKISIQAPLWTVLRIGPTAARGGSPSFTDTWDTADHFISALGGAPAVQPGQLYHARVCNQTSLIESMAIPTAAGAGVTGVAPVSVPAGTCQVFAITITALPPSAGITIGGG